MEHSVLLKVAELFILSCMMPHNDIQNGM